ncbi:ATP-dependent 6-phosphofructokinase 3, partial [Cucurbita argyrosperma subsp. sororia]
MKGIKFPQGNGFRNLQTPLFSEALYGNNIHNSNAKIVLGDAGYVLEDVPHLSDYISDLPTYSNPLQDNPAYSVVKQYFVHVDDTVPQKVVVHKNSPRGIHFRRAGPRQRIYFKADEVHACIVTCGGLCPGLNTVIRELVCGLYNMYGVKKVLGIEGGYRGFYSKNTIHLTPKFVNDIHKRGGTVLGTSRGGHDTSKIVDSIQDRGINQVYIIGGDGTQRGASAIYEEVRRRGLKVAVVGIPKTIDNDIPDHFSKEHKMTINLKYIDPTYMIRAIPSNASDNVYCTLLAQSAIHGAMAGYTGYTSGLVNGRQTYIPFYRITEKQNKVVITDRMWARLLSSTNQPSFLIPKDAVAEELKEEETTNKLDDDNNNIEDETMSKPSCSFVEHRNYKIVYRRYASLFFLVGVDNDENELAILEFIHLLVETMDRHFGNVCELDIMFHLEKAHFMLEEMVMNGCIVETSKSNILSPIQLMEKSS